jgi:hypothetical protein
MAATGLLNSNPYGKAVALDFSTKATNAAIQLIQKEQAKKDALDKTFREYEKSINSAGMREQDQNVFLDQMNDAKLYYLQNQERITMPSKYGAQYQSEYLGKLKNAQVLINESKQEAANTKIDADHYYQAIVQGLDVPDGYMEARRRADLPLGNPEHQKIDPFKWNFTKGFNEDDFVKSITRGLQSDETIIGQVPDNKGKILTTISYDYSNPSRQALASRAAMMYGTVPGVANQINKLIKSGEYLNFKKQFQDLFPGDDIENALPQQVAAAVGLGLTGHGKIVTKNQPDEVWLKAEALRNSLQIAAAGKANVNVSVTTGKGPDSTNQPHPNSLIEAVAAGNRNYFKAINTNELDASDWLGGLAVDKLDGIELKPSAFVYNKSTGKWKLSYPAAYRLKDEYVAPNALKNRILNNNKSSLIQTYNGPIIPDSQFGKKK